MSKVVSFVNSDGNVKVLALLDQLGDKSTTEGISSTIAVHDLRLGDGNDGIFQNSAIGLGNDSVVNTLGKDNQTLTVLIRLWKIGNVEGGGLDILGIRQAVCTSIGFSLTLVAKDNVHIRENLVQDFGEELRDERG